MRPPASGDDWTAIADAPLPAAEVGAWLVQPGCGAVVVFTGTVRDHAEGRDGVTALTYEAYVEQATVRLRALADEARRRWSVLGRIAMLHRVGDLALTDAAVVVGVSAPHRGEAFEAARWCIDTLKATVPIWKRETWAGGTDWGTCAHDVDSVPEPVPTHSGERITRSGARSAHQNDESPAVAVPEAGR